MFQKNNFNIIKEVLSEIPEVTFRKVPEGGEENYSFLNFFLPNLETSRKVIQGFKEGGVDACWNYFDNNWHYIRKWDHLKNLKSLVPISEEVKNGLVYLKNKEFSKSDNVIGRNISSLIKLSWTEEQVKERALKMRDIIKASL